MRTVLVRIPFLVAAVLALAACGDRSSGGSDGGLRWPGAEWEVSTPEAEGMDSSLLAEARAYAFAPGRNTQGVVVVRKGAIVAEWYAEGASAETLATSWSMAKSFASTLIGIAIDRGEIASLDVPLADFFPEWRGDERAAVTLRDLLEMRSGIQWAELPSSADLYLEEVNQLAFALDRPLVRPPGTAWNYSSADSMLLAGVIEAATGRSASDYARELLFEPIGFPGEWWVDGSGHTLTYCCIDARTRDYARFGLLFARGGEWRGRQVVSRAWVEEATRPLEGAPFYALHWWVNGAGQMAPSAPRELFAARGRHGQDVYVIPSLDLVVVRNGRYERFGTEAVRVTPNVHVTRPPDEWDVEAFLGPIVRSIGGAAVEPERAAQALDRAAFRAAESAAGLR